VGKPIEPTTFVGDLEAFLGLPPSAPPAMPEQAPAVSPVEPHARVLVVDDSRNNRDLMEHTLGGFGYAVTLAKNVNDALALATQSPPDLILSDLHMPNEDGYAFLRAVKATPTLAAVPFVFISSSVWGDKDSLKALALGASRFILRPIEPTSLIREIASFLPQPR
jgi:two-component system cell cycle response regulator